MKTVAAVVLAAGGSTRLGRPKQLLLYKGTTLVRRAAEAALASGASSVQVVVGASSGEVRSALAGLEVGFVPNDDWKSGMGSSIAAALPFVSRSDAALLLTCDQPAVTGAHLASLISRFRDGDAAIVASLYKCTAGVPALFARAIFAELSALDPAAGAKGVLSRDPARVVTVDLLGGEVDIDTEADYARLRMDK